MIKIYSVPAIIDSSSEKVRVLVNGIKPIPVGIGYPDINFAS